MVYSDNGATGGTVPQDTAYRSGASVTAAPNTLTRTGYSFAGWNSQADGSGTAYAVGAVFAMPAANVTLYALWSRIPVYAVNYSGNGAGGGTVPSDTKTYTAGASVTAALNTLTKPGYSFGGWNTQADGKGTTYAAGAVFSMPAANLTLHALWSLIPVYSVTYSGNGAAGGTVPSDSTTYANGASVKAALNTLNKPGYLFTGWNTQADGKGTTYAAGAVFAMPAANVTLYALWSLIPVYSVTYSGNGAVGGTVPSDPKTYAAGASVKAALNTLTKPGYLFTGWNSQADGKGAVYTAGAVFSMTAADLTLYAGWSRIAVTGVSMSSTSLALSAGGSPSTLAATVFPTNAADPSVDWQSSNPAVASVVGGVVTPLAAGNATITVTTVDGKKTAVCQVTVTGSRIQVVFELAPYQSLAFPPVSDQAPGASVTIAPSGSFDLSQGTNWRWIVNGVLQSEVTSSSWVYTPAGPGFYTVYATVSYGGVLYSGSFHLTVTQ